MTPRFNARRTETDDDLGTQARVAPKPLSGKGKQRRDRVARSAGGASEQPMPDPGGGGG
jgi:hypothetical protein